MGWLKMKMECFLCTHLRIVTSKCLDFFLHEVFMRIPEENYPHNDTVKP